MTGHAELDKAQRAILAHYITEAERVCQQSAPEALAGKLAMTLASNADRDVAACVAVSPNLRPLACAPGCSWCCRGTWVDLHAPEAILLADFLRTLEPHVLARLMGRVSEAAQRHRTQSGREVWLAQAPCALLDEDGGCIAYPVRPFVCRTFQSHDASLCERAHANPASSDGGVIVTDAVRTTAYGAARRSVVEAADKRGLDTRLLEMTHALHIALTVPDAAARWAAGEPVFEAAALADDPQDPNARAETPAELRRRVRNARKASKRSRR